eukprot:gene33060-42257_t
MLDAVAGYGFPKYTLMNMDETEELIVMSSDQASSLNAASSSDLSCNASQMPVTIVIEIDEYMDALEVSERPFKVRYDVYRCIRIPTIRVAIYVVQIRSVISSVHDDGDSSLSTLTASIDDGEATLVYSGDQFEAPPRLCLDVAASYALRIYPKLYLADNSDYDMTDSFFYVLGPCETGCFRPQFSANQSGCDNTCGGNGAVFFVNWRNDLWVYNCTFSRNKQIYTGVGPGFGGAIGGTNFYNGTVYVEDS